MENIADPLAGGRLRRRFRGAECALRVAALLGDGTPTRQPDARHARGHAEAAWRLRRQCTRPRNSAGTGIAPPRKLPLFMTLKGGLQQMTERLAAQVEKYRVFVRRRVLALEFAPGGPGGAADSCSRRFQIACEGGKGFRRGCGDSRRAGVPGRRAAFIP